MPFKLTTEVSVIAGFPYRGLTEYPVHKKERSLKQGEVVRFFGSTWADQEGKSWRDTEGEIVVTGENTIKLQWENEEPVEIAAREDGSVNLLVSPYHDRPVFGGLFTFWDEVVAGVLLEKVMARGDIGIKTEQRKTYLSYEPTMPMQSRK